MSSSEFTCWMAFDLVEPGEPARGDYRTAQILLRMYDLWTTSSAPARKLEDEILTFKPRCLEPQESEEDVAARNKALMRLALGV